MHIHPHSHMEGIGFVIPHTQLPGDDFDHRTQLDAGLFHLLRCAPMHEQQREQIWLRARELDVCETAGQIWRSITGTHRRIKPLDVPRIRLFPNGLPHLVHGVEQAEDRLDRASKLLGEGTGSEGFLAPTANNVKRGYGDLLLRESWWTWQCNLLDLLSNICYLTRADCLCQVGHEKATPNWCRLNREYAHYALLVLAASWPHAPSMSCPRVSRNVAVMPALCRISRNRRSSSGFDAVHFDPSMGLRGIGLTWAQLSP